ncbi:potassium channel subfamily K member 6-like [Branchiostoma floridae x Branchiostoma belcheri]
MRKLTLVGLLVVFVGYIFAGGGIFHWLEAEAEEKMREHIFRTQEELLRTLERFVGSHDAHDCRQGGTTSESPSPPARDQLDCHGQDCVSSENVTTVLQSVVSYVNKRGQNLTREGRCIETIDMPLLVLTHRQLDDIILKAHQAGRRGLDPLSTQQNSSPPQWSFLAAVGFSLTLVTTIGYGNIAPSTWGGRALCVVYGLIGIPLYLVLLDGVGRLPGGLVRDLAVRVYISRGWNANTVRRVVWCCLFTFGLFLFYLLPALVISLVESWTYLEALYYMFVSLSTIGFGDYVAGVQLGRSYWAAYKILVFFWIASGLAFLAMVFDLLKRGIQGLDEPDKTESYNLPKTVTKNRRQEKVHSNGAAGQAQVDAKSENNDYVYENMAMDKMQ